MIETSAVSSGAPERGPVGTWLANVGWVFHKDLLIERATREITTTSAFFACLVAVTASVFLHSGVDTKVRVAPGVIWISIAFAAVLAVSKSWHREREEGALYGLLVSPLSRSAIFSGKALSVVVFLAVVQAVVIPLTKRDPGTVRLLPNDKLEIVVPESQTVATWLAELERHIDVVMGADTGE